MKIIVPCLLAFACLTVGTEAAAAVKVRYYKGQPTFISFENNSIVEIALPPPTKDHRQSVALVVLNRGSRPATIGYENVVVTAPSGAVAKQDTFEQLEKQARTRAAWANFFTALAAGMNSYAASQSAYGNSYGTAYTSTPYGGVSTTYTASYYDPIAGQIAQDRASAQNAALFRAVNAQLDATLAKLDGSVLRTTTIDPGQSQGGAVVFELPKKSQLSDLTVTVSFAGETHTIALGAAANLEQASESDFAVPSRGAPAPPAAPGASPSPPGPIQPSVSPPAAAPSEVQPASTPSVPAVQVTASAPAEPQRTRRVHCLVIETDPSQNQCRQSAPSSGE